MHVKGAWKMSVKLTPGYKNLDHKNHNKKNCNFGDVDNENLSDLNFDV